MPHERGRRYKVPIICHFFSFIHSEHKCVDRLLIDVTAALVVENECVSRCKLYFSFVLHSSEFSNSLIDVAFVDDECVMLIAPSPALLDKPIDILLGILTKV